MSDRLADYKANITSQRGEDGMIAEVCKRLGIDQGRCVEFGAADGMYFSNTWNLWANEAWHAFLIEGDPKLATQLKQTVADEARVVALEAMVTPGNVDDLIGGAGWPQPDVLSIDVDGDDYHIWAACELPAKVVVIEYNPTIPAGHRHVQAAGGRSGASALSLTDLGNEKGYRLVGMTRLNLIFLREDLDADFIDLDPVTDFDPYTVPVVYSDYGGHHVVMKAGLFGFSSASNGPPTAKAASRLLRTAGRRAIARFVRRFLKWSRAPRHR